MAEQGSAPEDQFQLQPWITLQPSNELRARVKAYVPASPHFRHHYEKWRVRTQARTDKHVMFYLFRAANWLDDAEFPTENKESDGNLREDVWFNAACIVMFEEERGYSQRDIELHLLNWNNYDMPKDVRDARRDLYMRGGHLVNLLRTYDPRAHNEATEALGHVEDIDVDYMCRALRSNRVPLIMTTNSGERHEVWISDPMESEENESAVVVDNLYFDPAYGTLREEEKYEHGDADVRDGVLNVTDYGVVDLRSDGPNGSIVDDMAWGKKRSNVAAAIHGGVPTAPALTLDIAKITAEFGVLNIQDEDVFPPTPRPIRDTRKRAH